MTIRTMHSGGTVAEEHDHPARVAPERLKSKIAAVQKPPPAAGGTKDAPAKAGTAA